MRRQDKTGRDETIRDKTRWTGTPFNETISDENRWNMTEYEDLRREDKGNSGMRWVKKEEERKWVEKYKILQMWYSSMDS